MLPCLTRNWISRYSRTQTANEVTLKETAIALLLLSLSTAAHAQHLPMPGECRSEHEARLAFGLCRDGTFDFYATAQYRAGIPRPEQVLGYPIGSWHTTYGRMEQFITRLAATAPDRVKIFDYGQSVERQVMHLIAISSERNIARLEEIRANTNRLTDSRNTSTADAERIAADLPVTVWLNAANDGNETAAFEAAMQLAYQLAAGEDARTRSLRDGALILINLAHNPESHERFVAWYNAFVMGDANPAALEHIAPWGMSTNNNHYQFDLNRDALGMTQTETRAVAAELQRWHPQVFVDLHGQTTQMFFPPAADPINPAFPDQTARWLETFGRGNAAAFDQFGWSYFTRDVFDLYYPGYWDSYPSLHGATGMTFETDGGGSKGVRWRRDDGTILTFADGIAHHFVASLATIETAVRNRQERLRDLHRFFVAGLNKPRESGVRTVVLRASGDGSAAARLATTLLRHGIEVARVSAPVRFTGTDYVSGQRVTREVDAGSFVIDLAQPNGILAYALLAPDIKLPKSFADQMLERFAQNLRRSQTEREGYAFYDVTAWSLPLITGVDALWSGEAPALRTEALRLTPDLAKAPGGWTSETFAARAGRVSGRARSAYVWPAGGPGSVRLAAQLMGEGFNVAVSSEPTVVDGVDFERGAYIVRIDRNATTVHERIAALATDAGVDVHAAASAFAERGPSGTGGNATRTLYSPRIAVASGEGVDIGSYGALWFELERRVGQPFSAFRATANMPIDNYGVLILPSGNYSASIGSAGWRRIREWVEGGGTLIAYGGAASWVQQQDTGEWFVKAPRDRPAADTLRAITQRIDTVAPRDIILPETSPEARPDLPQTVPGAILRTRLDLTHWLTTGYERSELPVLMRALPLRTARSGATPVTVAKDRIVIAGFSWPDNTQRSYAGGAVATVTSAGRGNIVLFAVDPLYRGTFDAPAQLLMNAIYLGAPRRPLDH